MIVGPGSNLEYPSLPTPFFMLGRYGVSELLRCLIDRSLSYLLRNGPSVNGLLFLALYGVLG